MLNREDRIKFIAEAATRVIDGEIEYVATPSGELKLNRFYLPIEHLRYNISNGRTASKRLETFSSLGFSEEKIKEMNEVENQEAQDFQHNLLKDCIKLGSDKDIVKLLRDRGQTRAIWIKNDGEIINGNRRTCALREDGKEKIIVVLLPNYLDRKDIKLIEAIEQYGKEGKSVYIWHSQAAQFHDWLDSGLMSIDEISKFTYKTVATIRHLVEMYKLGSEYLRYKKKPNAWSELDDQEETLKVFSKKIMGMVGKYDFETIQQIKKICFSIMNNIEVVSDSSHSTKIQTAHVVNNFLKHSKEDPTIIDVVEKEANNICKRDGRDYCDEIDTVRAAINSIDKAKVVKTGKKKEYFVIQTLEKTNIELNSVYDFMTEEDFDGVKFHGCLDEITKMVITLEALKNRIVDATSPKDKVSI